MTTDHTPGDNDTPPASSVPEFSDSAPWGDPVPPPLFPAVQDTPAPYAGYPQPFGTYPPAYGYGAPPPQRNNGLAIAALVVSCVAAMAMCASGVGGLLGIVGAVLGHVARRQIRRTGDSGAGLALAGIIVGWVCTAAAAAMIAGIAWLLTNGAFGP